MTRFERYRPREIRLLERWRPEDWRIKMYRISAEAGSPPQALVRSAKREALRILTGPAARTEHYGVGFSECTKAGARTSSSSTGGHGRTNCVTISSSPSPPGRARCGPEPRTSSWPASGISRSSRSSETLGPPRPGAP